MLHLCKNKVNLERLRLLWSNCGSLRLENYQYDNVPSFNRGPNVKPTSNSDEIQDNVTIHINLLFATRSTVDVPSLVLITGYRYFSGMCSNSMNHPRHNSEQNWGGVGRPYDHFY